MHETHPLLLHIVCICNKTNLFNIAWVPTECCWVMDIFGNILSNCTVGPLWLSNLHAFFKYRYNIECDSKSIVECELRQSVIIIYSMQADISNALKIKRKLWMAATLWFRSTSLKTTLISVEQESAQWNNWQVTLFTACASRSTIAQLNPLSSTLMRWYGKLPCQNHQKPESTTPDDWQHRLLFRWCKQPVQTEVPVGLFENVIFLQALYKVAIQRNFFKMAYGKGAIEGIGGDTKRVVAQVVGSCDDALEIVPVKGGASPMQPST